MMIGTSKCAAGMLILFSDCCPGVGVLCTCGPKNDFPFQLPAPAAGQYSTLQIPFQIPLLIAPGGVALAGIAYHGLPLGGILYGVH